MKKRVGRFLAVVGIAATVAAAAVALLLTPEVSGMEPRTRHILLFAVALLFITTILIAWAAYINVGKTPTSVKEVSVPKIEASQPQPQPEAERKTEEDYDQELLDGIVSRQGFLDPTDDYSPSKQIGKLGDKYSDLRVPAKQIEQDFAELKKRQKERADEARVQANMLYDVTRAIYHLVGLLHERDEKLRTNRSERVQRELTQRADAIERDLKPRYWREFEEHHPRSSIFGFLGL